MWMEIVKNGGALQRLVANKYIGEKKKDLYRVMETLIW